MSLKKYNGLEVVIIGLPRSGTSFLTGLIHRLGYNCGPEKGLKDRDLNNLHGYYEFKSLNRLTSKFYKKHGFNIQDKLPDRTYLLSQSVKAIQKKIQKIIKMNKIELYKDNKLSFFPELYSTIYDNIKWIYIERDVQDTYKSRFGEEISLSDWIELTEKRKSLVMSSGIYQKALKLNYEDFSNDFDDTLNKIVSFLEISPDKTILDDCRKFYLPRKKK